jgi:hypothetical protein
MPINATNSFQDGEVLGRIINYVMEGSNPGFLDESEKLLHAKWSMIVFRDLNGGLQMRIGVEVFEHLLLNISVLPSHVTGESSRVDVELPTTARYHL